MEIETTDRPLFLSRFDVPVLGLEQASLNEIVLSARATFGPLPTADVVFFEMAVKAQGTNNAEVGWLTALAAGNLKAHFRLGYTDDGTLPLADPLPRQLVVWESDGGRRPNVPRTRVTGTGDDEA